MLWNWDLQKGQSHLVPSGTIGIAHTTSPQKIASLSLTSGEAKYTSLPPRSSHCTEPLFAFISATFLIKGNRNFLIKENRNFLIFAVKRNLSVSNSWDITVLSNTFLLTFQKLHILYLYFCNLIPDLLQDTLMLLKCRQEPMKQATVIFAICFCLIRQI